jgi:pyruvate kinase
LGKSTDAPDEAVLETVVGGLLKEHKGINLPGSAISAPAMTEKDKKDLLFGLE